MLSERFARALEYLQLESRLVPERLALLDALEIQLATTFPPSFKAWYAQEHEGRVIKWLEWISRYTYYVPIAAEDFLDWVFQADGKRFLCLWYNEHDGCGAFLPLDDSEDKQIYIGYESYSRTIFELRLKNLSFEDFVVCNLLEYVNVLWPVLSYKLPKEAGYSPADDVKNDYTPVVIKDFSGLFIDNGPKSYTLLPRLVRYFSENEDSEENIQTCFLRGHANQKDENFVDAAYRLERMSDMLGFDVNTNPEYQNAFEELPQELKARLPECVQFWYTRTHGGFPIPWHEPGFGLPLKEFTEEWGVVNRTNQINHIHSEFALLLWRNLGDTQVWKLNLLTRERCALHDREMDFSIISQANTFEDFMISRVFNWIIRSSDWVINHTRQEIAPEDVDALFSSEAARAERDGAILATLTNRLGEQYVAHHEYFLLTAHSLRRIRRMAGPEERYLLETAELYQTATRQ